jgi:hypothetical protein
MSLMHVTHIKVMRRGKTLFSATEDTTLEGISFDGKTAAAPRIFVSSARQSLLAREMAGSASRKFSEEVELYFI